MSESKVSLRITNAGKWKEDMLHLKSKTEELYEQMQADIVKQFNKSFKETILQHAEPKIKGDITKGKLKWRGIKYINQPEKNLVWIEQRGKQIGNAFSTKVSFIPPHRPKHISIDLTLDSK